MRGRKIDSNKSLHVDEIEAIDLEKNVNEEDEVSFIRSNDSSVDLLEDQIPAVEQIV